MPHCFQRIVFRYGFHNFDGNRIVWSTSVSINLAWFDLTYFCFSGACLFRIFYGPRSHVFLIPPGITFSPTSVSVSVSVSLSSAIFSDLIFFSHSIYSFSRKIYSHFLASEVVQWSSSAMGSMYLTICLYLFRLWKKSYEQVTRE